MSQNCAQFYVNICFCVMGFCVKCKCKYGVFVVYNDLFVVVVICG